MNDRDRYLAALHAMQTGVKYEIELGINDAHTPKHLRVGVNSAMVEHGALIGLLISKGVITEAEYYKALADTAEREVEAYAERISERLGTRVNLA